MRLRSSLIAVAMLALFLTSAVPVAGARSSATLTDTSDATDCYFSPTFTWANYGRKTYAAHIWVLYDGNATAFDHTVQPVEGTGTLNYNFGFSGLPTPEEHGLTIVATLSTAGDRPRVLVEKRIDQIVHCGNVGD